MVSYIPLEYSEHSQEFLLELSNASHQRLKRNRTRAVYSAFQQNELEREFHKNMYMICRQRCKVAQRLNLSESQVKVWFQNRRMRLKRDLGAPYDKKCLPKPPKPSKPSLSKLNVHQAIVKRLMSYSAPRSSTFAKFEEQTHQRGTAIQSSRCNATKTQLQSNCLPKINANDSLEVVPPSIAQNISFNLDSVPYDADDFDLVLQIIENDLESLAQQLSPIAPSLFS